MTVQAERLFATPGTAAALAHASAVVLLIGSYDGSGNFGDIAQLDAALKLVEYLGPSVIALPVIEASRLQQHRTLLEAASRPAEDVLLYGSTGDDRLQPVSARSGTHFVAIYLYGGGFLNLRWGDRKLAMVRAAETFATAGGIDPACRVATGLQIEAAWAAELADDDVKLLRRFDLLGARDGDSARTLASIVGADRVFSTGDDAVGVLDVARPADPDRLGDDGAIRVNVHVADHSWMGHENAARRLDAFVRHFAASTERQVTVAPFLAYEDACTSDVTSTACFIEACGAGGVTVEEARLLRPSDLDDESECLARGQLTISCSYHVGLASLMLGVPTVLLHANDYYYQKAAGLQQAFCLPTAYVEAGRKHRWEAAATEIAADVLSEAERPARSQQLLNRQQHATTQRGAVEHRVLALLASTGYASLTGRLAERDASLRQRSIQTVALMDQVATLRDDRQTVLRRQNVAGLKLEAREELDVARAEGTEYRAAAKAETDRRLVAEAEADHRAEALADAVRETESALVALAAAAARAEACNGRAADLERRLQVAYRSRSWTLTAPLRSAAARMRGRAAE